MISKEMQLIEEVYPRALIGIILPVIAVLNNLPIIIQLIFTLTYTIFLIALILVSINKIWRGDIKNKNQKVKPHD